MLIRLLASGIQQVAIGPFSAAALFRAAVLRAVVLGAAGILATGCLGGGSDDGDSKSEVKASNDDCVDGEERCPCYGNGTCNGTLECLSKLCVNTGPGSNDKEDAKPAEDAGTTGAAEDNGASGSSSADNGASPSGDSSSGGSSADSSSSGSSDSSSDGSSSSSESTASDSSGGSSSAAADTPVGRHGQLSVSGTLLVDEHGDSVQLKGISSMWLNWEPTGYAESLAGLRWMRDEWGLQVIRAAMGVDTDGAYLVNPDKAEKQVRSIVDHAIELGVYVIIDWHDHDATAHQPEAEAFFSKMAAAYGDQPNVLYELFNEPLELSWTGDLKPYHTAVSAAVREQDPDNIIILGTPNWSQDVDIAAQSPVSGSNLMYTLHFYSCSHDSDLRGKAQNALNQGLPLFVTEWGASHADGGLDGVVCESEAARWHDWMDANVISWAAWKLDGCEDTTCIFKDRSVSTEGGWDSSDLNGHAPFVIERMQRTPAGGSAVASSDDADSTASTSSNSCEPSGSCAAGTGMDCIDDELAARDCAVCALLSCGIDCCGSVGYFGAVSRPDFEIDMDIIAGFSSSSSAASLDVNFDFSSHPSAYEEIGVIAFNLDSAYSVNPGAVLIEAEASSRIEVSLEDGDAGCVYEADDFGGVYGLYGPYACWGGFDESSGVRVINVRLVGVDSGSESLTVTSVSW